MRYLGLLYLIALCGRFPFRPELNLSKKIREYHGGRDVLDGLALHSHWNHTCDNMKKCSKSESCFFWMPETQSCVVKRWDFENCDRYERDWAALRKVAPKDPRLPMTELEWKFNELLDGR